MTETTIIQKIREAEARAANATARDARAWRGYIKLLQQKLDRMEQGGPEYPVLGPEIEGPEAGRANQGS